MTSFLDSPFADLTPPEIACFCFTADQTGNQGEMPSVLASKDAIVWALAVERFVDSFGHEGIENIVFDFEQSVVPELERFIKHLSPRSARTRASLSPYQIPLARYEEVFGLKSRQISSKRLQELYRIEKLLEKKGLIRDPFTIEIPGYLLLVLGMVPTEFSIKTKKGEEKFLRMKALLWDFEIEKKEHDHLRIDGSFKVFKIAQLVKETISKIAMKEDEKRK